MKLICAVESNYGIGLGGSLPWKNSEEMNLFIKLTKNSVLVMGRKTVEKLPKLSNVEKGTCAIWCLTRKPSDKINTSQWKNPVTIINTLPENNKDSEGRDIFIAGGAEIYNMALSKDRYITEIYISVMKTSHITDTFINKKYLLNYMIKERTEYNTFTHDYLVSIPKTNTEHQYLTLAQNILYQGDFREGRNGTTISSFSNNLKVDLREGFPLLTTKKMFLRGIIEEFIFFLKGETDSSILSKKGVKIWEGNTSSKFIESCGLPYAEGIMGPMYGYQWRFFNSPYILDEGGFPLPVSKKANKGIDQLADVIELIKTDPNSRRILLTAYNPSQARKGVLYPCHSIIVQFYVSGDHLDMFCYNRSQDLFLGVPFNIASSSLLLMTVAKLTEKTPRYLHITMGDTHIYEEHIDVIKEQITRIPFQFPTLILPDYLNSLDDIDKLKAEDFILYNYNSHPTIRAKMIS